MEIVSSVMTLDKGDQLKQKIADLKTSLEQALPGYESLLFVIHKEIREDPEISHFLSDEDIGITLAGLAKKKGIVINEEKVTAVKKLTTKGLSKLTVSDL